MIRKKNIIFDTYSGQTLDFNSIVCKTDEAMDPMQIYNKLFRELQKEYAFWSYDKQQMGHLTDDVLIAKVLLHLDIDEISLLFSLFPKRKIQKVWKDKMLSQEPVYHGLNRLYSFLFFNIKNPDRYIRDYQNKRYKSIRCKA